MFDRLRRRIARDQEIQDEIRAHIEADIEQRMEAGMSAEEAKHAVLREFGSRTRILEDTRAMYSWTSIETILHDIRYGLRQLTRSMGFSLFVILSLALGIGATSAMFSLFNAIVLREIPVKEPGKLLLFAAGTPDRQPNYSMPFPHFQRMHDHNTTLAGLFAIGHLGRIDVTVKGQSGLAMGQLATGAYHRTLGLQPALGRLLTENDDKPGSGIAVISYSYWQSRFAGSPAVLGSGITVNQIPFTIVGVEPHGFSGVQVGTAYDVLLPMRTRDNLSTGEPPWDKPYNTWIYIMGRLKDGISRETAATELGLIYRQVNLEAAQTAPARQREFAERFAKQASLHVESGATGANSSLRGNYQRWMQLVLTMLGAVLLLAALNVATLLLARSERRQKELATRAALGAGRWRLVRQLFVESFVLATLGSFLGLVLAWWGSGLLLSIATSSAPDVLVDLTPDARLLVFTMGISGLMCLLFGLLPALRATSPRLIASRQVGGGRHRRLLDRTLVASQVGLSLVLLVCAGLFLRSLNKLWAQDPGYDRRNVLMFSINAGLAGKKGPDIPNTYRAILDELRTAPGVQSASLSAVRPVDDGYYFVDGVTKIEARELPQDQTIRVAYNIVTPGYFKTLGVPILAGRDFDDRDAVLSPHVAIISETMARRHFPKTNPVGQRITLHQEDTCEIVGVAKDTRYGNIKDAPRDVIYRPLFQGDPKSMWYAPTVEIRYAGATADIVRNATEVIRRVDRGLTPFRIKTLEVQTEESLSRERLLAFLASYFGAFALLLACVGLYGLLAYAVTQRTPELGLRMALGARPARVRWLVLRESLGTVLAGVAFGLLGSLIAVRFVRTQLFGVEPYDPVTLTGMTLLLLAMAIAASYLPAARASRIDPVNALRHE